MIDLWECIGGDSSSPSVCNPLCGDGKLIETETCDDGSDDDTGCNSTCTGPLPTFTCTGGTVFKPTKCNPICGDGRVFPPETCDADSSQALINGCNSTCNGTLQGWTCSGGDKLSATICTPICGDGVLVGVETCDDGDISDNFGCNSDCIGSMPNFDCTTSFLNGTTKCFETICGDMKKMAGEVCDDADLADNIGCLPDCSEFLPGWFCHGGNQSSPMTCSKCGNNVIDQGENCDDNDLLDGQGCTLTCASSYPGW